MNFKLYSTFRKCCSELIKMSVMSLATPNIAVYTMESEMGFHSPRCRSYIFGCVSHYDDFIN